MGELPQIDYKELFHSLPGRYIIMDADDPRFTIVEENEGHAQMAMVKRDAAIGRGLFEVFPDTSEKYLKTGVSDLAESFRRVIKTGKPDTMAGFRYDLKDPKTGKFQERHWLVTHYPLFGAAGKVTQVYQSTADITDERLTSEKLARTQRQLDEALSVGMIGTWVWNIGEDKVFTDKNLARMFGVSEEEGTKGLPLAVFTDAIHPDDRKRVTKAIEKTVAKHGSFESEYRTVGRDGTVRWVIARGRIEANPSESVTAFPGVIVDITDRKLAEERLSFLTEASTVLASSLDYTKTLQTIAKLIVPDIADWCSIDILQDKTVKQVALAHKDPNKVKWAKELRKQQPMDLSEPTGVPNVLRTGKPEFYPEITDELLVASAKDPEQLKILREIGMSSIIITPLKVNNKTVGAITMVSAEQKRYYTKADYNLAEELATRASMAMTNAHLYESAQDELAKRKELQDELHQANEELEARVKDRTAQLEATNLNLERSNQELQDFAYVASHDLQEPLRKIQAFGNLLEGEYAAELGEGKDYLSRMRSAAARMSALIEDLLSFSRVTTKARAFVPVSLPAITDEVLGDLETRIADTKGKVIVKTLPTIDADPVQMRQLLQNLIANALKFHQADTPPVVTISASTHKDNGIQYCKLLVEDNGVGFDEKYLDRIFSVFQRLHGRESYEGTGIGLAVCRKIVERHGGAITATSKPDIGSTFIITLPLRHKKEKV